MWAGQEIEGLPLWICNQAQQMGKLQVLAFSDVSKGGLRRSVRSNDTQTKIIMNYVVISSSLCCSCEDTEGELIH